MFRAVKFEYREHDFSVTHGETNKTIILPNDRSPTTWSSEVDTLFSRHNCYPLLFKKFIINTAYWWFFFDECSKDHFLKSRLHHIYRWIWLIIWNSTFIRGRPIEEIRDVQVASFVFPELLIYLLFDFESPLVDLNSCYIILCSTARRFLRRLIIDLTTVVASLPTLRCSLSAAFPISEAFV